MKVCVLLSVLIAQLPEASAIDLRGSPRVKPAAQAVEEEAAMSPSQAEELKRETQEEEKILFGHSEEESGPGPKSPAIPKAVVAVGTQGLNTTADAAASVSSAELDFTTKEMNSWMDSLSRSLSQGKGHAASATVAQAPTCSFSVGAPTYPPSQGVEGRVAYSFLNTLSKKGINIILGGGSLLGAYRHHGSIPFDMDLDGGIEVCDSGRPAAIGAGFKWSCQEAARLSATLGKIAFNSKVYHEWMAPKLRYTNIKFVKATNYGIRLSNGAPQWDGGLYQGSGIGLDLGTIFASGWAQGYYLKSGNVCKCKFGNSFPLCPVAAAALLKEHYGASYMTPRSQCDWYAYKAKRDHHANWNARSTAQCGWARTIKKTGKAPAVAHQAKKKAPIKDNDFAWIFKDP